MSYWRGELQSLLARFKAFEASVVDASNLTTGTLSDDRLPSTMSAKTFSGLITTNGQIAFPATQNPSADANTLDDYEEGTWTPILTTTGTDFSSVTYDPVTTGKYTKIGNVVLTAGRLRTDAVTIGSASGFVQIGGFPFAPSATNPSGSLVVGAAGSWNAQNPFSLVTDHSVTRAYLEYRASVTGGHSLVTPAGVNTGANSNDVEFAGIYFV